MTSDPVFILDNAAAFWSAVAALFTALTAYLVMRIQRDALRESVRPEIVLSGFARAKTVVDDIIYVNEIKNVGRGVALRIIINCDSIVVENKPVVRVPTRFLPIIAVNETFNLSEQIILFWQNAPAHTDKTKGISLKITIYCGILVMFVI